MAEIAGEKNGGFSDPKIGRPTFAAIHTILVLFVPFRGEIRVESRAQLRMHSPDYGCRRRASPA
jgi:hypothetical protein